MSAEIFKAISIAGFMIFLNCLILMLLCITLDLIGESSGYGTKFCDLMKKCDTLLIVIGTFAIITAINCAILYALLSINFATSVHSHTAMEAV